MVGGPAHSCRHKADRLFVKRIDGAAAACWFKLPGKAKLVSAQANLTGNRKEVAKGSGTVKKVAEMVLRLYSEAWSFKRRISGRQALFDHLVGAGHKRGRNA